MSVLVTLDRDRWFEIGHPAQPGTGQNAAHGGSAEAGLLGDTGSGPALSAQGLDQQDLLCGGGLTQPRGRELRSLRPSNPCSR